MRRSWRQCRKKKEEKHSKLWSKWERTYSDGGRHGVEDLSEKFGGLKMSKVRVATCVPRQFWMQAEKLAWLDAAIGGNPCDIFLLPQEYVGGGSMREICRLKGIKTDDFPDKFPASS